MRGEPITNLPPKLLPLRQRPRIFRQFRQRGERLSGTEGSHCVHARRVVIDPHTVERFHTGPAALFVPVMRPKIILARQDAEPIEISRLDDFVDAVLIVRDGPKVRTAARHDLTPNVATARHVPEEDAAVEEIRRIPLPQHVARAHVFDHGRDVTPTKQFLQRAERLQAEHIVGIDDEREVDIELVDEFHATEVNLAEGMRKIRLRTDEVILHFRELALGQAGANDEGVEGNAGILLREAGERVIEVLGGFSEGHGHNGGTRGVHAMTA